MAGMQFEFQFKAGQGAQRVQDEQAMKILLLGDFSGANIDTKPLAQRRTRSVDIDNLDTLIAAYSPKLLLDLPQLGQTGLSLEFHHLDDFTPDHLYGNLPLFNSLRETRKQLQNPATFSQAVAKLGLSPPAPSAQTSDAKSDTASTNNPVSEFAALLGGSIKAPASNAPKSNFEALIQSIVAPHIVRSHDPSLYVDAVDDAVSSLMRAILHHPSFQALEAAWRSVHYLITNLELDENLQLHVLNVNRQELAADVLASGADLSQSALHHLLIEVPRLAPDGTPWALILGDYHFNESESDVAQLAAIGALAAQARAPFIAAARSSIVGSPALHAAGEPREWQPLAGEAAARWQALRATPQAAWLGLVLPRLLLRLPYGKGGEHVEQFEFDESIQNHQAYLWGNPCVGCGLLLGLAFQEDGWEMQAGAILDLNDMPAYTFKEDGETKLLPAAETCLLERASDAINQAGVMTMLSYKNRNAVRLLRFQSLAHPSRALAGPWRA